VNMKTQTIQDSQNEEEFVDDLKNPGNTDRRWTSKPVLILFGVLVVSIALPLIGLVVQPEHSDLVVDNDSLDTFDLTLTYDNYVVPNASTNYICKGFLLPNDTEYHLIEFEPLKDNREMLHHMILYQTTDFVGDDYFNCESMPKGSSPVFVWAVGAGPLKLPDHVGFRVGSVSGHYVAIQIHYDNPNNWSGRRDSSGVRMVLTKKLRPIDAGYFVTGVPTSQISLPASRPYYEISGTCDTSIFTNYTKGVTQFTLFRAGLHMHTLGRQMYTEQFRKNSETGDWMSLGTTGCDNYYSFNDQKMTPLNKTMIIGDRFISHCVYDTSSRKSITRGCEATDCEMCINYIAYYPKVNVAALACRGAPVLVPNNSTQFICTE